MAVMESVAVPAGAGRFRFGRWLASQFGGDAAGGRYAAMEGLRAYAALLIFFVHFSAYFSSLFLKVDQNSMTMPLLDGQERYVAAMYYLFRSHYGVDLFFLLSGFLICRLVLKPDFHYFAFLGHRINRIYPAYLIGLAALLLWWTYGRGDVEYSALVVLGNVLLLNSFPQLDVKTLYTINWSLGFEFAFYILFPMVLGLRRQGERLQTVHVVVAGVVTYLLALALGDLYVRFLMFYGGVILAMRNDAELRELARAVPDWLVLVLYVAATTVYLYHQDFRIFTPVFLPAATLLVLNAMFGTGFLNTIFSFAPLRFLGNVSFSFYLVHATVIDIVFWLYRQTPMTWKRDDCLVVGFILCMGFSILFASLIYLLVERRYFRAKARQHAALATA
jgi:exopolysaccharide production protein ExoZ